jgi:hypothetical protein
MARVVIMITAIDTAAETISIVGSAVMSKLDRKRASRVAFPATWWAIITPQANIAVADPISAGCLVDIRRL